jgi:aspartyl protease family protein
MKFQHIYWACFACVMLAGVFRFSERSLTPPAKVVSAPVAADISSSPFTAPLAPVVKPSWTGKGVILNREGDGHFYASAIIQDRDITFLIDTGASAVALTARDAEAMGLFWNPAELILVGRGVNGNVMGKPVIIPSIQVGDLYAKNVQAAIIPEGLDVSLLGQSFLSKVGTVNISNDQMTLQ